jgi:zinc transporter
MENIEFEDDSPCELNVLITIIDTITDEISQYIEHTVDHVDEIEEQTLFNHTAAKQDQLTRLRRNILFLKRHITPQREALKQLCISNASRLQSFQPAIQQLFDTHLRMIEELDLARERCSLLQERISNKLSEQINRRMYLFSLITALFLPISSIASLFGMNLGGIPLSTASWGFGEVCGILFGISSGVFVYLKKKRWF